MTLKLARVIGQVLLLLALAIFLTIAWSVVAAYFATFFGFCNGCGNGSHYLFWSGSGSDLQEVAVIWAVLIFYRTMNCKRGWCPFIGMHPFTDPKDGVTRKLCWFHHPDVQYRTLKARDIEKIHRRRRKHSDEHGHMPERHCHPN